MAKPDRATAERALRVIQHWAGGGLIRFSERCLLEIQQLNLEREDARAVLLSATVESVDDIAKDENFADRTVVVMKSMRVGDIRVYVKVSIRLEQDHDVLLVSFHR